MALVDLKLDKKELAEEAKEATPYSPDYPYGFCLRVEGDEMDKLGIKGLPKVGDEFHIMAVGRVTSVSSRESEQDDNRSVEIQITAAELTPEVGEANDSYAEERGEAAESHAVNGKSMMRSSYRGR